MSFELNAKNIFKLEVLTVSQLQGELQVVVNCLKLRETSDCVEYIPHCNESTHSTLCH